MGFGPMVNTLTGKMRAIDTIVQVAMLGTATQALTTVEAPEPLERLIEQLRASSPDRESFLYWAAASTFAYHRAGWTPERLAEASAPVETAPAESLPTLSAESIPLFASLLSTSYLLAYALQKALPLQRILPPVLLPKLLERMRKRNLPRISEELEALQVLGGHRFPWLMNLAGLKILQVRDSSAWDTSTHRERRAILANLHGQDPAGAIELLQKDWKGLSSSHRMDFLWELGRNPNPTDEPFLQSVMEHDRSSQVRELAMHLLGGFPGSALVQRSRAILRGHIHYSRLTGWHYDTIAFTQEMKSLGLQEVCSRSN